jgi:hypothetical protein
MIRSLNELTRWLKPADDKINHVAFKSAIPQITQAHHLRYNS